MSKRRQARSIARTAFKSRFVGGGETNPEELLGAAHAACFSMALSGVLTGQGHPPTSIHTTAAVHINPVEGGFAITKIELETVGEVPAWTQPRSK